MKLDKIKLSGFKSFADQITIPIQGNLTAVVGPNGCGKSNVIDAVRWVMGESSAKHLRGGNMADVIFNGSSGRKPVSVASVELIFDNSEGKAAGEYAKYNSISIRRQVSRDGQSQYHLNGTKCRRKDITDLFLGTGLGARSYAIIEQGTISRMVESKPEELRQHIEEAAGISKYKERRHETETRMRHTRENLQRLNDLREEVEKQLENLKKQSEKAEKYTGLKKQERQYKKELLALRWNSHHQTAKQLEAKLQEIAQEHNRLFVLLRQIDQSIDNKRIAQKQQQQRLDAAQEEYYHLVAEVSRLQQAIKHNELSHEETVHEMNRLEQQVEQSKQEQTQDLNQLETFKLELEQAEEKKAIIVEQCEENQQIQQQLQEMQKAAQLNWEEFMANRSKNTEQLNVEKANLAHLLNQSQVLQQRTEKLQIERDELSKTDLQDEIDSLDGHIELIESDREDVQNQLEGVYQQIMALRQHIKSSQDTLHQNRTELHKINGKISSLELLQQNAMGKDKKALQQWLEKMNLQNKQRLAEFLEVDNHWETAVETVLTKYLEAICLEDDLSILDGLSELEDQSVILFHSEKSNNQSQLSNNTLLSKVNSPWDLSGLLTGIYCCESLDEAIKIRSKLLPYESVVTKQGDWVGRDWVNISRAKDDKAGVLHREKELRHLKLRKTELTNETESIEQRLEHTDEQLKQAEINREQLQQKDKVLGSEYSTKSAQFSAFSAKQEQQQQRINQISREIEECIEEATDAAESIEQSKESINQAETILDGLSENKDTLIQENEDLASKLTEINQLLNENQNEVHALQGQIESLKASESLTSRQVERLQAMNQQSIERIAELQEKLNSTLLPLDDEKLQLDSFNEQKLVLEEKLQTERSAQQENETEISELSEQHAKTQREMEQQKELLDKIRFEQQDSTVRQQTISEQLTEIEADPEQVLQTLSAEADEQVWKNQLDNLTKQIERLGSINLTAIEEYKSQSERMNFLNEQHEDLMSALSTLDQAINKIDRESRQRFKQTFDKINLGLQTKFPKLFGGGHAYLELTEDDLLEAGVNIIARPPGKRNSSIHLLSGGEKALTAVALVFSIFDLNPAPFCLLDEVDAPLDDANVVRFSKMVEEMSETVQFLYISHNKVTMEIAKQLTGVTMKEPGVSRMVSVDIEEAVSMAES